MRVTISIGGRFHAFDMAAQLHARSHLLRLITSYPASKVAEWPIPRTAVRSLLSHELLCRGYRLAAGKLGLRYDPQFRLNDRFDRIAARHIPAETTLCVAWSGMALHTHRRAASVANALTVLERNSSHIEFYRDVLIEEAELFGGTPQLPDPRMVERELAEYAAADIICLPSTFALNSFLSRGFAPEKLIVVPFGASIEQFPAAEKPDSVFRIIHCGSLTLRKGVHYLLQAFHNLSLPNAELWLIGGVTSEIRPYLDRFASPSVHVRGTFPQAELHRQYRWGSVFCLASIEDGFAMVLPQAMACGLPVICTENTAAYDLVRPGVDGYIVPIRSVESLQEKILELYRNPERTLEMGRNARLRIETTGTWDHYGDRLIKEYERLLAPNTSSPQSVAGGGR